MIEPDNFICGDCMDYLPEYPDKYFDLAVVDPPYGIGINNNIGRRAGDNPSNYPKAYWDNSPPDEGYFSQLLRISMHAIIWGGNYFNLPPTKCFIVWQKPQVSENVSFAMCEYAWTNFDETAKVWRGMSNEKDRIHATQKPVALYDWILSRYAKPGQKILDTHVGSASSLIACHKNGMHYVGFEKDPYYYELASKRLNEYKSQMTIFDFGVERLNKGDDSK